VANFLRFCFIRFRYNLVTPICATTPTFQTKAAMLRVMKVGIWSKLWCADTSKRSQCNVWLEILLLVLRTAALKEWIQKSKTKRMLQTVSTSNQSFHYTRCTKPKCERVSWTRFRAPGSELAARFW